MYFLLTKHDYNVTRRLYDDLDKAMAAAEGEASAALQWQPTEYGVISQYYHCEKGHNYIQYVIEALELEC